MAFDKELVAAKLRRWEKIPAGVQTAGMGQASRPGTVYGAGHGADAAVSGLPSAGAEGRTVYHGFYHQLLRAHEDHARTRAESGTTASIWRT